MFTARLEDLPFLPQYRQKYDTLAPGNQVSTIRFLSSEEAGEKVWKPTATS